MWDVDVFLRAEENIVGTVTWAGGGEERQLPHGTAIIAISLIFCSNVARDYSVA
jgi:hypothetical protein